MFGGEVKIRKLLIFDRIFKKDVVENVILILFLDNAENLDEKFNI